MKYLRIVWAGFWSGVADPVPVLVRGFWWSVVATASLCAVLWLATDIDMEAKAVKALFCILWVLRAAWIFLVADVAQAVADKVNAAGKSDGTK